MKNLAVYLVLAVLITSCESSLKLMNKGDYDVAIQKSEHKLEKKKQNDQEAIVLEQSYQKANERDKDRIIFLKKEGKPESWDEIFVMYARMSQRQENIKPLLPLHIAKQNRDAHFDIVNYSDEIIQAKQNATEYFYAHSLVLLEKNNKSDARQAYVELRRVKALSANYKEVDKELALAKNIGTSYVLFRMRNTTGIPLPPSFEDELTKITLGDLNTEWIVYHTHEIQGLNYDYTILVNMKNISVSPDGIDEKRFTESKTVPDGFKYMLDARGNVKKDSAGNDIKEPKFKAIFCDVIETYQTKKAIIAGSLDFINNSSGQLMKTEPISSEKFFEYRSWIANGDINALKPETAKKLDRGGLIPFPSGFDMLLDTDQTLKGIVRDVIFNNKAIVY